MTTTASFTKW